VKSDPGTYTLVFRSTATRNIRIGRLGTLPLRPGYYIYLGSAFGPGGTRARTARHLKKSTAKRWHIDYLKPRVELIEIWYTHDPVRREHDWANALIAQPLFSAPLPGFGSSDCKCLTHLLYSRSKPDIRGQSTNIDFRIPFFLRCGAASHRTLELGQFHSIAETISVTSRGRRFSER
jgi:Uri superfamily endonuclease